MKGPYVVVEQWKRGDLDEGWCLRMRELSICLS